MSFLCVLFGAQAENFMIINTVSHNFRAAGATLLLIFGVHFQRFPVIVFPFLYLKELHPALSPFLQNLKIEKMKFAHIL